MEPTWLGAHHDSVTIFEGASPQRSCLFWFSNMSSQ